MADAELEQYDAAFANTTAPAGKFDKPKDGPYKAVIEALGKRTWRDKPQVSWRFKIVAPDSVGRTLFRDVEVNAENLARIRDDLNNVGLVLTDGKLSSLPDVAGSVIGREVMVTAKTNKNGYQNVYIDGLAGDPLPF
jgi:hypothetical protein